MAWVTRFLKAKAIAGKRRYPTLDTIVRDAALRNELKAAGRREFRANSWSLASCLLDEPPDPYIVGPTLSAIEENLRVLRAAGAVARPRILGDRLVNGLQLLDTIAELCLARTLLEAGWSIELDTIFFEETDADICCRKDSDELFIDVISMALRSLEPGGAHFGSVGEYTFRDRIVEKVVTKFREKFEHALGSGWGGRCWVALDVGKDDEQTIDFFAQQLLRPSWRTEFRQLLRQDCAGLEGAILFRSDPTSTGAFGLDWLRIA